MTVHTKTKTFLYDVGVRWGAEKRGVLRAAGRPVLEVASPPEFKGHPGVWTPEHLLVAAVNSCTLMTFLSACARRGVSLLAYESDATGTLENVEGSWRFTRVVLRPRITVADAATAERAREAFREAEKGCLITNSLSARVEAFPEVIVGARIE